MPAERDLIPADVHQPSYNVIDHFTGVETQVFGVVICGVPHGETGFRQEWLRLKAVEICDKIELISKSVATSDPHCSAAVTVLSLQTLADFILATNYPSDTEHFVLAIDAALEKAFARSYGVNLLDPNQCHPPNSNPLDQNFIPDRAKLRSSRGGAAIRPLADRQLFFNSMCNVIPQLIDHKDSTGNTTPGLFPSLSNILGAGSFDHDNGETRWRQFLGTGSQAAAEFSSEYEKGKAIHATLVSQTNHAPDSEKQRSIFDQTVDGFGFGIKKIHKAIQDERQLLKHIILTERAQNLPIVDIRRMAFIANGTDSFARQFLGTTPVADTPFTPSEYTTAVALHMGGPNRSHKESCR